MVTFLTTGTILGLAAGIAPGPLLTLVVSETLQHGIKSGIKVALAPILTDLPIALISLYILAKLSNFHTVLGVMSIMGGSFLLYLGVESIRVKVVEIETQKSEPKSLQKGIIVNALNPHPYLFWISVGGPTTIKALSLGPAAPISFIASFYVLLVGSKIVLAILVDKSRSFLSGKIYISTMRMLGLVLILLAAILFRDGFQLLGLI